MPPLVDEGEEILQIGAVVQIEEFGGALRIVARQRVRRDIVDLLVADPDDAAVIERRRDIACRFAARRSSQAGRRRLFLIWRQCIPTFALRTCDKMRASFGLAALAYARAAA